MNKTFTVELICKRPSLRNFVRNSGSRETCSPMKRNNGSITSMRSSTVEHMGTCSTQSGKKKTKSLELVPGGVGAHKVIMDLRRTGWLVPDGPKRDRGSVKLGFRSFVISSDSYRCEIECRKVRNIRSAISGFESTSHGNLAKIATEGFNAPTARSDVNKATFWLRSLKSDFFDSAGAGVLDLDCDCCGADSNGAASANWLILAPAILVSMFDKYSLCNASISSSKGESWRIGCRTAIR